MRYSAKISAAPAASGRLIRIFRSRRPGRITAASMRSSRLVAPITITFLSDSTPSISASSCGTIVVSISEERPVPRVRKRDSISSKNTTTGCPACAFSRAAVKISRICRSVSPTNLSRSSGPLILRKYPRVLAPGFSAAARSASACATALAIMVLPLPGGPYSRIPLGGARW